MKRTKILGWAGLGVVGFLAWKRGLFGGARGVVAQADIAQQIADSDAELDACGNSPMTASAWLYASRGVARDDLEVSRTPQIIGAVGGGVAAVAGAINPVAGAVASIATLGATMLSVFSSRPPDPVLRLIIMEMPYNWTGRSNTPMNVPAYAIDRCGYKHRLLTPIESGNTGYLLREVVAVNWKVFAMLPEGAPINSAAEIDRVAMPRPGDAGILRATLGTDIRFIIGREERIRGPWDADANVPPLAGSPAMWAAFAGEYTPTHTASAGEF